MKKYVLGSFYGKHDSRRNSGAIENKIVTLQTSENNVKAIQDVSPEDMIREQRNDETLETILELGRK